MIRAAVVNLGLIPRDLEMVAFVFEMDGCTIDHLLQVFFPTYSAERKWGPRTSAYMRIKQLVAGDYLRSHRLPSASGIGSGKYFLTVGPSSFPLLEEKLGLTRSQLRSSRDRLKSTSVPHHLSIVDVRVAVLLACQRSGHVQLEEWINERQGRSGPIVKMTDPKPVTELDRLTSFSL